MITFSKFTIVTLIIFAVCVAIAIICMFIRKRIYDKTDKYSFSLSAVIAILLLVGCLSGFASMTRLQNDSVVATVQKYIDEGYIVFINGEKVDGTKLNLRVIVSRSMNRPKKSTWHQNNKEDIYEARRFSNHGCSPAGGCLSCS